MTSLFRFFFARAAYRNRLARIACGAPRVDRMASEDDGRDVPSPSPTRAVSPAPV